MEKIKAPWYYLTLLILAGESVFFLPYVLSRIFRPTVLEVFQINNVLSQKDRDCEDILYPNIITKNSSVYLKACNNKNEINVYSMNGRLNSNDFKILENRIFFYSKGLFFVQMNDLVKKILVL